MIRDVPSPIDLCDPREARVWEAEALEKRPMRPLFFARYVEEIAAAPRPVRRVLELGSGPGFLAAHIVRAFPEVTYVALDVSVAMHELAADRLGPLGARVTYVERSFRDPNWADDLGTFDAIVTHQAVHELRHKAHACALHRQVFDLLTPDGTYLVGDHFAGDGGMVNTALFMSLDEQVTALARAGFATVERLMRRGTLALHRARCDASRQPKRSVLEVCRFKD